MDEREIKINLSEEVICKNSVGVPISLLPSLSLSPQSNEHHALDGCSRGGRRRKRIGHTGDDGLLTAASVAAIVR